MVIIATENPTKRLEYIAGVLFDTILKVNHLVIPLSEIKTTLTKHPEAILIYYMKKNTFGAGDTVMPAEGLLEETNILKKQVRYEEDDEAVKLHFSNMDKNIFTFDFDIFSAAFYLVTEYEKYAEPKYDTHGRYDFGAYDIYAKDYHKKPLLEVYAKQIWNVLKKNNPDLTARLYGFSYQLTIDIDNPFLFKGRNKMTVAAGVLKDIAMFRFSLLVSRLKYIFTGRDDYDVFDEMNKIMPGDKTSFFILLDNASPHDGKYKITHPLYAAAVRKLSQKFDIGIHPSYTASKDPSRIIREKKMLESVLKKKVTISRMHYVKYKLPETFQYLQLAGVTDDYTICNYASCGFPSFIARSYPFFDLQKNEMTNITIHPTIIMDRSLQKYQSREVAEAKEEILALIQETYKYNGNFVLAFHNETLTETHPWKGWKKMLTEIMEELKTLSS